jgi:hypothetical protein
MRILSYNFRQRHAMLAAAVQDELDKLDELDTLTTRELCERLWPETASRGEAEIEARASRFPQAILKCRFVLDGWWKQGEPEERRGRSVRPILWLKGERKATMGRPAKVDIRKLELRVAELESKVKALQGNVG